jgi:hypothetical protein
MSAVCCPIVSLGFCAPSLNRPAQFQRLKNSINMGNPMSDFYGCRETEPRALTAAVNELFTWCDADIAVMLADHIFVKPEAEDAIRAAFTEHFPDFDGVIGLGVTEYAHKYEEAPELGAVPQCAFPAVGRKFLERFPNAEVFCPDYYHFHADSELGEFATTVGKFAFLPGVLNTFHPNARNAEPDATHHASRKHQKEDNRIRAERRKRGLLWGQSFERVTA